MALTAYERNKRWRIKKRLQRDAASASEKSSSSAAVSAKAPPSPAGDIKRYTSDFLRSLSPAQMEVFKGWLKVNNDGKMTPDTIFKIAIAYLDREISGAEAMRADIERRKEKAEHNMKRMITTDDCDLNENVIELLNQTLPDISEFKSSEYGDALSDVFKVVRILRKMIINKDDLSDIQLHIKWIGFMAYFIKEMEGRPDLNAYVSGWSNEYIRIRFGSLGSDASPATEATPELPSPVPTPADKLTPEDIAALQDEIVKAEPPTKPKPRGTQIECMDSPADHLRLAEIDAELDGII